MYITINQIAIIFCLGRSGIVYGMTIKLGYSIVFSNRKVLKHPTLYYLQTNPASKFSKVCLNYPYHFRVQTKLNHMNAHPRIIQLFLSKIIVHYNPSLRFLLQLS